MKATDHELQKHDKFTRYQQCVTRYQHKFTRYQHCITGCRRAVMARLCRQAFLTRDVR